VLGAFGGPRLDHALANVWLLGHPGLRGRDVALLDDRVRVRLLVAPDDAPEGAGAAELALPGRIGAVVSLLPLAGDAVGITTRGLRFPLRDEDLTTGPARGLSNVRTGHDAAVRLRRGRLLAVEASGTSGLSSSA
jgi:thiamine pyrophosphokinase